MDTRLVEGIPVPSHLRIEWQHHRYIKPVFIGEKPVLRPANVIHGDVMMPNGGKTICTFWSDGEERKFLAIGEVECSLDDSYVKAVGRKRSLSQALSAYYASNGKGKS